MNKFIEKLEFNKIINMLTKECSSSLGQKRLKDLNFLDYEQKSYGRKRQ